MRGSAANHGQKLASQSNECNKAGKDAGFADVLSHLATCIMHRQAKECRIQAIPGRRLPNIERPTIELLIQIHRSRECRFDLKNSK
jgi:hypothetical protein